MNFILFAALVLGVFTPCVLGRASERIGKFGKHGFAKKTPLGEEVANEFQMLMPHKLRDGRAGVC